MANNVVSYGFVGLEHLFAERLENIQAQVIDDAIRLTVEEHNRMMNELLAEFAEPTTAYTARFRQPGTGTLQPLDEWGNPIPTRPAGYYDVAWPIQGGGDAYGFNRVTRALATVGDVNRHILDIQMRDADWMMRHILAAVFDNTTWTFDDPEHGNLTVQPLALASDNVTYPKKSGTVATDTHHLAQSAAIADATNPFDDIYLDLSEHPVNRGPFVSYIASNLVATTEALTGFAEVGDPDVDEGADATRLTGQLDRSFGDMVIGKTNKMWIVEWGKLPDNYIVSVARGATSPPLRMRQYPATQLQGLFREDHSPDGNLQERRYIRYAGFGAFNRVGAMVNFVSAGDTTYDIPAGYEAPLAV